ncbi:hypothetical protein H9L39_09980 [Fusarium oxysporum f. sp. albedinis]|nr:hypothetical protein H9L39_09980 [Fusarium oxysporum f. sp. albedinis]
MPNVASLLTPRLPIRSRCLAFRSATTREMMIFSADDPAEFEKLVVFGRRSLSEEGRFRDIDKIVDVEATSWEVPRLGGELYNA